MIDLIIRKYIKRPEINVALGYVALGVLWILFSDQILISLAGDKEELTLLQSYKGIFYIFASGLFVYFLAKKEINKREKIELQMLLKEKELQMHIVQSEERERNRIAKDIHDGLQQKLAGLNMFVESLKPNEHFEKNSKIIRSLIQETMSETRNISFNLNSSLVERKGLKESLKSIERNIKALDKVKLYINCSFEESDVPYILKNNIYRIVQELITNTIKHAKAQNIDLHLWQEDNALKLSYSDNGIGMDDANKDNNGQGIHNIKERVKMLSGDISISDSSPGFSVNIDFELNKKELESIAV